MLGLSGIGTVWQAAKTSIAAIPNGAVFARITLPVWFRRVPLPALGRSIAAKRARRNTSQG
jgi:hypothetical protein